MLFDLGTRPDWECCAPKITSVVKVATTITRGQDVATMLNSTDEYELSIRTRDVEAIIWSHNHFDHIGDPSTFPPETELVVGPKVKGASWPGYPSKADATVLDRDMEGRDIREIDFDSGLRIGSFDAYDYFGDGSFYLLDAPGHAVGHLCALARTTVSPPSFVFMGADACHHVGVLRPSHHLPVPASVDCSFLTSPTEPPLKVSRGPMFLDPQATDDTIAKIQELDAMDEVLVVMAHDVHLLHQVPFYPNVINDWKAQGLGAKTRWSFVQDFSSVLLSSSKANTTLPHAGHESLPSESAVDESRSKDVPGLLATICSYLSSLKNIFIKAL